MELKNAPLWRKEFEHDACGTGFVADISGKKSHQVVRDALVVLKRLAHRGGAGYDPDTGDGAGILIQLPDGLFRSVLPFPLPGEGQYGAGMFFFPRDSRSRQHCIELVENAAAATGFTLLGWRDVPHNLHACGTAARAAAPYVMQAFVTPERSVADLEQARTLTAVVFDKTGTLTTGQLSVTRITPAPGIDGAEILRVAGGLEQMSRHPVARAITEVARRARLQLPEARDVEEVSGRGVRGVLEDGTNAMVGRATWLSESGADMSILSDPQFKEPEGISTLYVVAETPYSCWKTNDEPPR
jgi:hypothetical protein